MKLKRFISTFLTMALVFTYVPWSAFYAYAEDVPVTLATDTRVVDGSTIHEWEKYFSESVLTTEYAGGVWTDKSVFKNASEFSNAKDFANKGITMTENDNFIVAMSALASNKQITGYSNIPTDTVFVLDVSGSMSDDAIYEMVESTNKAMQTLFELNNHNRVGIVTYATNSYTLLEIDRYETDATATDSNGAVYKEYITYDASGEKIETARRREETVTNTTINWTNILKDYKSNQNYGSYWNPKYGVKAFLEYYIDRNSNIKNAVSNWDNILNSSDAPSGGNENNTTKWAEYLTGKVPSYSTVSYGSTIYELKNKSGNTVNQSISTKGGTYVQGGLNEAKNLFLAIDKEDTYIATGKVQAGTQRIPTIVLMSDGQVTIGNTNYTNATNNANTILGQGYSTDTDEAMVFATQLTASYVLSVVEDHYSRKGEGLFYTLGLNVASSAYALEVLNPKNSTSDTVKGYWEWYKTTEQDKNIGDGNNNFVKYKNSNSKLIKRTENRDDGEIVYGNRVYADSYIEAGAGAATLTDAFQAIVDEIILQSKYYPTLITTGDTELDGYVTFEDELGGFMEVKDIKGMVLGNTLYSGSAFGYAIATGNYGDRFTASTYGWELLESIMKRINIDEPTARALLSTAYQNKQISCEVDTKGDNDSSNDVILSYSNYIGWYSDAEGNYLGWWDGTTIPDGNEAAYVNKCYVFQGEVEHGSTEGSQMMHIIVQVHQDIKTSHQKVIWKIPASLIPVVTYEVKISGDELREGMSAGIKSSGHTPLSLVFEVGLRNYVNEVTVADIAAREDVIVVAPNGNVGHNHDKHHIHSDGNGGYYFYTNLWNKGEDDANMSNPELHEVTYSHFHPNTANERYYFAEDSIIYVEKNGSYEPYKGTTAPVGGNYYYARKIIQQDSSVTLGQGYESYTGAKVTVKYVPISSNTLTTGTALCVNETPTANSQWYVPKGTVFYRQALSNTNKTTNATDTLNYVWHPIITNASANLGYDVHSYLGNNGRIQLIPASGIKLTKTIDTVEAQQQFTFKIELSEAVSSSSLTIYDADYNVITSGYSLSDDGKTITVGIKSDETIYIVGIGAETEYTITEVLHPSYAVKEVKVNGVTEKVAESDINDTKATDKIEANKIDEVLFVNTHSTHKGNLHITKDITHPYGDDYVLPTANAPVFDIVVTIEKTAGDDGKYHVVSTRGNDTTSTDAEIEFDTLDGKYVYTFEDIGWLDAVTIYDIPENVEYTVTETNLPAGFENGNPTSASTGLSGTIISDTTAVASLVNNYIPDTPKDVNVKVSGTKAIVGRDWQDGDNFTFVVKEYYPSTQTYSDVLATKTVEYAQGITNPASFSIPLNLSYSSLGTHYYRIMEVEGTVDVTYDQTVHNFRVEVTDADLDGEFEIAVYQNNATIAPNNNEYNVTADFTNDYFSAPVKININKVLNGADGYNISKNEFSFVLCKVDCHTNPGECSNETHKTVTANIDGEAVFNLSFKESDKGNSYQYYLYEVAGNRAGMTYDSTVYPITITVDAATSGVMMYAPAPSTQPTTDPTVEPTTDPEVQPTTDPAVQPTTDPAVQPTTDPAAQSTTDLAAQPTTEPVAPATEPATESATESAEDPTVAPMSMPLATNGVKATSMKLTSSPLIIKVTESGTQPSPEASSQPTIPPVEAVYPSAEPEATPTAEPIVEPTTQPDAQLSVPFTVQRNTANSAYTLVANTANNVEVIVSTNPVETVLNATFTNTYSVTSIQPGSIKINGRKTLEGRDFIKDANGNITEQYSFGLYKATVTNGVWDYVRNNEEIADPILTTNALKPSQNNGNAFEASFDFTSVSEFSTIGQHYFIIKEIVDEEHRNAAITYDTTEYQVVVTVYLDEAEAKLKANVVVLGATDNVAAFTNKYSVKQTVKASIAGAKQLDSAARIIAMGDYSFQLYNATVNGDSWSVTGDAIETVSNGTVKSVNDSLSTAAFAFSEIEYRAAGDYNYIVKEVVPESYSSENFVYDTTEYRVTIRVTDNNGDGNLEAATIIHNLKNAQNSIVFENSYNPTPVSVNIGGSKILLSESNARIPLTENYKGEFNFHLYEADADYNVAAGAQPKETARNTVIEDGYYSRYNIDLGTFEKAGEHYYVLKEAAHSIENDDSITTDARVYNIKVVITDSHSGKLQKTIHVQRNGVTTTYSDDFTAADFTNRQSPLSAKAEIVLDKVLDNQQNGTFDLTKFKFVLCENSSQCTGDFMCPNAHNHKLYPVDSYGDGKIEINFNETNEGESHTYYIYEQHSNEPGITYDISLYKVDVEVSRDKGVLKADTTLTKIRDNEGNAVNQVAEKALFENKYELEPAQLIIDGTKTLNGRNIRNNEFKFELYEASVDAQGNWTKAEQAKETVANSGNTFAFSSIEFNSTGTYYYTVNELVPVAGDEAYNSQITYDTREYNVTIEVTDTGLGKLSARIVNVNGTDVAEGAQADISFANTFTSLPVTISINGTKTLDGNRDRELQNGEFSFAMYLADENFEYSATNPVADKQYKTVSNIGDAFAFEAADNNTEDMLYFADEATRHYVVKEIQGNDPTITYSQHEYNITVVVSRDGDGILVPAITVEGNQQGDITVAVTNTYTSQTATANIPVKKQITNNTNQPLSPSQFSFGLYNDAGCTDKYMVNGSHVTVTPDERTGEVSIALTYSDTDLTTMAEGNEVVDYNATKTFTYWLREIVPAQENEKIPGVTYDTTVYKVDVELKYVSGTLTAIPTITKVGETTASAKAEFTNKLDFGSVTVELPATKKITGRNWTANDSFTFKLYETIATGNFAKGQKIGSVTVKNTGRTDDVEAFEFTTANLTSGNENKLTFTQTGTYYFVIVEENGGSRINGLLYDASEYIAKVTVSVGDSDADGIRDDLVTTVETYLYGHQDTAATTNIDFNNVYTISDTETVKIGGTKVLRGRDVRENEFRFRIYDADAGWNVSTEGAANIVTNGAQGTDGKATFAFADYSYTTVGKHYYVVREINDGNPTITYDNTEYRITVDITDAGDGTLAQYITVEGGAGATVSGNVVTLPFANAYTTKVTSTADSALIEINKVIINNTNVDLSQETFTFGLYDENNNPVYGVKEGTDTVNAIYKVVDSSATDKQHITITGTQADNMSIRLKYDDNDYAGPAVKYYKLKEIKHSQLEPAQSDIVGMTYSTTVYNVTVTLSYQPDGNNGQKLTANAVITDAAGNEYARGRFENRYALESTTAKIEGGKTLKNVSAGQDVWSESAHSGKTFTVQLYETGAAYNYSGKTPIATATVSETNRTFVFNGADETATTDNVADNISSLNFSKAGTYYFVVKESKGNYDGVRYDGTEYGVKVEVSRHSTEAKLVADVSYHIIGHTQTVSNILFENKVVDGQQTTTIGGTKNMSGRNMKASEFTFELYQANVSENVWTKSTDKPYIAITNKETDTSEDFSFGTITYPNATQTYYYVIEEANLGDPAITYSTERYGVKVAVEFIDSSHYSVTKSYYRIGADNKGTLLGADQSAVVFNNSYTQKTTSAQIDIEKVLVNYSGVEIGKNGFVFGLYTDASCSEEFKVGDQHVTATSDVDGKATIILNYTDEDISTTPKEYYLKEIVPAETVPAMTYDTAVYKVKVTVAYVTENGNVVLKATPVVEAHSAQSASNGTTTRAVLTATFRNVYQPTAVNAQITGSKQFKYNTTDIWNKNVHKDKTFEIELYKTGAAYQITGETPLATATVSNTDRNFAFSGKAGTSTASDVFGLDTLKLTSVGKHYFVVVEKAGSYSGITYDGRHYAVEIEVVLGANGNLEIKQDYPVYKVIASGNPATEAAFDNSYSFSNKVTVPFKGTKTLVNRAIDEKEFTFELYNATANWTVDGNAVEVIQNAAASTANGSSAEFVFESMEYTVPGTHHYIVREVNGMHPTITYDSANIVEYRIKVEIADNGDGTLAKTVTVTDMAGNAVTADTGRDASEKLDFTNVYTTQDTVATINIEKQIANETAVEVGKDGFVFGLYTDASCDESHKLMVGDQHVTATSGADGRATITLNFSDKDIATGQLNAVKTYYLKEIDAGAIPGMDYDDTVYTVTITLMYVKEAGTVSLVAKTDIVNMANEAAVVAEDAPVVFVNTYTLNPASANIKGTKQIDFGGLGADYKLKPADFQFELYNATVTEVNGVKVWTAGTKADLNDADNLTDSNPEDDVTAYDQFVFDTLTFDKAGSYHYIVKETKENYGGITYDESRVGVTVTVGLKYNADNTPTDELKVKSIDYVKIDENGNALAQTPDSIVFSNKYKASGNFSIGGEKQLVNRDWNDNDEFTFAIYKADSNFEIKDADAETAGINPVATKTVSGTSADKTFVFSDIAIDGAGKHYFVIKEIIPANSDRAMIYDTSEYHITVDAVDNLNGTLKVGTIDGNNNFTENVFDIDKVQSARRMLIFRTTEVVAENITEDEIDFVNTYNTKAVTAQISGIKQLVNTVTGRTLQDNEFEFALYTAEVDAQGNWVKSADPVKTTANKGADFVFKADDTDVDDVLSFTQTGEYFFIVKEVPGYNPIVTYDATEHKVKVTVEEADNAATPEIVELKATVEYLDGDIVISNAYNDMQLVFNVNKKITKTGDIDHTLGGFVFKVENVTEGIVYEELVSDNNGETSITIGFTGNDLDKVYEYKISEKNTSIKEMSYDDTVYTVKVAVRAENGKLVADIWIDGDMVDADDIEVEFNNTYSGKTPPKESPKDPGKTVVTDNIPNTGDISKTSVYMSVMAISGAAMVALFILIKRRDEETDNA